MNEIPEKTPDYIFQLDSERRREIDGVKTRMEDFLKTQIELKHAMELVSEGQKALKERFEVGTANSLKQLIEKFDAFRVEWGEKKAEDKSRDIAISSAAKQAMEARDEARNANENFRKYLLWPVVSVCVAIIVSVITYAWKHG